MSHPAITQCSHLGGCEEQGNHYVGGGMWLCFRHYLCLWYGEARVTEAWDKAEAQTQAQLAELGLDVPTARPMQVPCQSSQINQPSKRRPDDEPS